MVGQRLDEGQPDPLHARVGLGWVGLDAQALVAHHHVELVLAGADVHLERALVTVVGVQHDVVAGLAHGGLDVRQQSRLQPHRVGDAGECLPHDGDVLGAIGQHDAHVGRLADLELQLHHEHSNNMSVGNIDRGT